MKPPFDITNKILELISTISEKIGEINATHLFPPTTELRKKNRIKTIQSSLEIEGNTMTIEQVTALLNNERVLAPEKDILEVKNAIKIYQKLDELETYSIESLCFAHSILMNGLVENAGRLRQSSVGIVKGNQISHIAPSGDMINGLMKDLFSYLKNDNGLLLIKSCVFHYEFEFIHPFTDGNGRMGRLWQTLILKEYSPIFKFLPIEILIKERQQDYYDVLSESDKQGKSTSFIEFMLEVIDLALEEVLQNQSKSLTSIDRIQLYADVIGRGEFTRKDYMRNFKQISSATASRDLKEAVDKNLLKKIGDKRTAKYSCIERPIQSQ